MTKDYLAIRGRDFMDPFEQDLTHSLLCFLRRKVSESELAAENNENRVTYTRNVLLLTALESSDIDTFEDLFFITHRDVL